MRSGTVSMCNAKSKPGTGYLESKGHNPPQGENMTTNHKGETLGYIILHFRFKRKEKEKEQSPTVMFI